MAKLLVIDDEATIRFSIAQVFAGADVEITGAETAAEGLRLAEEDPPDVILLDIRLGNRSGLDVFHELRRLNPKSLIIFMTGHGTTDTAIEAMKMGAYDYLVKPLGCRSIAAGCRTGHRHQPIDERANHCGRRRRSGGPAGTSDRQRRRDAIRLQANRPGSATRRERFDHGGKRHRQGVGCAGDLSSQPTQPGPLFGNQLCGHSRIAAGKRTLWIRTRCVYRRRNAAASASSNSRTEARCCWMRSATWPPRHPSQDPPAVAGKKLRAIRRQRGDYRRCPGDRRH